MKRHFITIILSLIVFSISSASEWLWPVTGKKTGENVLYAPQTYIDHEPNTNSLFIGGEEGDEIIAPSGGKVDNVSIQYYESLTYVSAGNVDVSMDFNISRKKFAEQSDGRWNPRYVSHSITIITPDGRKMHIAGLKLRRQFKTGETVTAGDKLGNMAYSYKNVPVPSIMVCVSHNNIPSDPMASFGMKSTFKKPEPIKPVTSLTAEQAREDFNILIDAIIDCYPSLDELISKEGLEAYRRSVLDSINGTISFIDFSKIMSRTSALIHDSHLACWSSWPYGEPEYWDIDMGRVGDSLKVVWATDSFKEYLNRSIKSVDGISPDSIIRHSARLIPKYDGNVADYVKSFQFQHLVGLYINQFPGVARDKGYTVTFDNGETLKVKRHVWRGEALRLNPSRSGFNRINRYRGKDFETSLLNDSTAYIGLSTFNLDEISVDSIRDFIGGHITIPHLIVDVRNNGGGEDAVLRELLSYCTDKPFVPLAHRSKVNRRGHFQSMSNCMNYTPEMELFGEEYVADEGHEGIYTPSETSCIMPDSLVAYGGKLYVLTNENSCSAATLFPANVLRSHRGVIVGRETRTAYSHMTALKLADFMLPNSKYNWRIPLVKCIFDETESPRIPRGRGVIPDVYVPLTYEEVAFTDGDAILARALQMIAEGEYLGDNPFEEASAPQSRDMTALIVITALISALSVLLAVFAGKRRRKNKTGA